MGWWVLVVIGISNGRPTGHSLLVFSTGEWPVHERLGFWCDDLGGAPFSD